MKPRMTEHPILFSTSMVQAILAVIKLMTRRTRGLEKINENPDAWNFHPGKVFDLTADNRLHYHFYKPAVRESSVFIKCPYGQPGDKLWVRETWEPVPVETASIYENASRREIKIRYKADTEDSFNRWHPSIHMPKATARIWLEITNIRVERLQDISEDDAKHEGVLEIEPDEAFYDYEGNPGTFAQAKGSFFSLWTKINGKESMGSNPWLWVIEFKRIDHE